MQKSAAIIILNAKVTEENKKQHAAFGLLSRRKNEVATSLFC